MIELNDYNGASKHTQKIAQELLSTASHTLIGCEMGIAFGGGIEKIGTLWRGRGFMFGFDTFEGHPKQLAAVCPDTIADGGPNAHATYCMDPQYRQFGSDYGYEKIRARLDTQGLHNVILVKGLITKATDIGFIPYLDYVLLDMDFPISMRDGYELVKHKIRSGGYLCLHDVIPKGHIRGLNEFYQEILAEGLFESVLEDAGAYLAVLRKK